MADQAIVISEGVGTNVDTRTESTNGNHRQVVVLGDPAENAGVAPVDATYGLGVDVKRSVLPEGASTSEKQTTANFHLEEVNNQTLLLHKILVTLRKIEIHLSEASGTTFSDGEIEEED